MASWTASIWCRIFVEPRHGPPHEVLFWRMGNKTALRHGAWKIVRHRTSGEGTAGFELYNLDVDIGEAHDRAAEKQDVLYRLVAEWERIDAEMVPPVWNPRR